MSFFVVEDLEKKPRGLSSFVYIVIEVKKEAYI